MAAGVLQSTITRAPTIGSYRYVVVWLPLISLVVRFTLWEVGLSAFDTVAVGSNSSSIAGLPNGDELADGRGVLQTPNATAPTAY